jgi:hypothetical protein
MIRWKYPLVNISCQVCNKKRARRHCPGVRGEICATCCGTGRENTIDCPLDCVYLQEARQHEQPAPIDDVPNKDIRISEDFLREHEPILLWISLALAQSIEKQHAVDFDAREALEAIIKTYRTRESGLIYESRPQNPYAAAIQQALQESIADLEKRLQQESGMHTLRDSEVLNILVFLQRLELQHNNGRRRGRAFYQFLHTLLPAQNQVAGQVIE